MSAAPIVKIYPGVNAVLREKYMHTDSPVRWNKKIDKILDAIKKQIACAPQVKTISLNAQAYDQLVDTIPEKQRAFYENNLKINGYTIRKVKVTTKNTTKR
jgi:hypothetical protein